LHYQGYEAREPQALAQLKENPRVYEEENGSENHEQKEKPWLAANEQNAFRNCAAQARILDDDGLGRKQNH